MTSYLPVILVFLLYFSGIPIAYALLGSSLFYFTFLDSTSPVDLIFQKFVTSTSSFSLLAIPFFIMAGSIMNYAGISEKLLKFADVCIGHLPGGLAQSNVLLSMLMGGVSGSANADAAMQSKMLVPEMEKSGYSKAFSAAITAASSAVTPVIPPGINLIIYALIASVSVGKVFTAGYVPGILMAVALMITVGIISRKRGYKPTRERRATAGEVGKQAIESIWALLFPFGIIMGLRIGLFTPSEAGAVAVLYCLVVGKFIYKNLHREHIIPIIMDTITGTASVVLIIVSANVFSYYMSWESIPQKITTLILAFVSSKYMFLLVVNILLLLLGMFIEGGAALIVVAPLLCPVASQFGIDLVHFGLVCIVNIMIGGLTPPFGSMMFTCCSITNCEIGEFVKECLPFVIALLVTLLVLTYVPQITMFVPNLVYGS